MGVLSMADMLEDSRRIRLLDWLTTPPGERQPDSMNKLADELGVTARALRYWRDEPQFRAAWEKQAKDIIGDPEKVQMLLLSIYQGAMNTEETLASRVRAAETFLKYTDAIKPPAVDEAAKKLTELSDAQLAELVLSMQERDVAKQAEELANSGG